MTLVDAGNSRIKLKGGGSSSTPTLSIPTRPCESIAERLAECADPGVLPDRREQVWGVSVCSSAEPEIERALGTRIKWMGRDIPLPVPLRVEKPEQIGPDRVLNAFAAWSIANGAAVAVSCGTAITFDVAAEDGAFLGGAIAAGLALCAAALHEHTECLPRVELSLPVECPAGTTHKALNAGIILGAAGAVSRILKGIRSALAQPGLVVLTGGDATLLAPLVPEVNEVVPDLTLKGLALAVRRLNQE